MVKKNEYPRKTNFSKTGAQVSEPVAANTSQKSGEFHYKENNTRNNRPPRENQHRDNNSQKVYQQREAQKRDNISRENNQKNYHRENTNQNRENKEPYRQHYQRTAIKPQAEETVEDITMDISRIEKEIELELKEIKSLRLGV